MKYSNQKANLQVILLNFKTSLLNIWREFFYSCFLLVCRWTTRSWCRTTPRWTACCGKSALTSSTWWSRSRKPAATFCSSRSPSSGAEVKNNKTQFVGLCWDVVLVSQSCTTLTVSCSVTEMPWVISLCTSSTKWRSWWWRKSKGKKLSSSAKWV